MKSILLPTIENALEYGYEALQEPDDLYHSLGWLLMDEEIRIARPFSVVCIPDSGGSAIAATWGLVVDDTAFWPFMRIDSVLSGLFGKRQVRQQPGTRRAIRSLLPNAYLGALRGGTTRMPVAPGLDAETTLRAIGEVLDGVEAMASDEGLGSVAFFYVPAEDAALRAALTDRGYLRFGPMHNVSVLQVTTFSDYLGRLSTSRRRNVAWERNKIARAGVRIQVEPLTRELSEDMLPLEAQLYRKYGHETHPTEMARTLHHSVIDQYGGAAVVITARADGVLRGYAALIQVHQTLYSRDAGFDYAWQGRLPVYFEVVFYRAIELAEQLGCRQIYYSYAADETKAAHGCDLLPRDTYVKATDARASAELRRICADLTPATQ